MRYDKNTLSEGFKHNKMAIMLYASAIAFFMFEYFLVIFGVNAFELDDKFMFSGLIALIA